MKVLLCWTIGASILVTLYSKDTFPQSGAPVRVLVNQQATLFRNVSSCVALDMSVKELENITLLCFAKDVKDVTWFHNDARILQSKIDGLTVIDKVFQNRVSLKDGAFKEGDLSLTLLDVSGKDVGLYLCRVNHETAEGYPYAQMLRVIDIRSSPEGQKTDFVLMVSSTINIVFALVIVVPSVKLYNVNRIISQSTSTTSRTSQPVEESERNPSENEHMLPVSVDESQSAQEFKTDLKSSSTRPF